MPSFETSEVEPTASAPSAAAGRLAMDIMVAANTNETPVLIIVRPFLSGFRQRTGFEVPRQSWRIGSSQRPCLFPVAAPEHQRLPLAEGNARFEREPLRP